MFLFFLFLFNILNILNAIESLIWSKKDQNFIPLFNFSTFSEIQNVRLQNIKELENHNFQKETVTISYYSEPNLVSFTHNNTKLSGVCGDIWTVLAEYLNFTLVPLNQKERQYGSQIDNGSFDGLLGLIQQNNSQIIARSGAFPNNLPVLEYTFQLWKNRYAIYIRPTLKQDDLWVYHLFSKRLWYLFIIFLLILSVAGYIEEKYTINSFVEKIHYNLIDHLFYTIAIAFSQACIPSKLYRKSKIYFCTSTFSWILLIAFSTHAINHMMKNRFHSPFTDLKSLLQYSKYQIIVFKGSMVHTNFQNEIKLLKLNHNKRINYYYTSTSSELYQKICFSEIKALAIFEAEDHYKAIGKFICKLVPLKTSYFDAWIVSGIKRGYRYKRSFDNGIIKLYESGILSRIKIQWFNWNFNESMDIPFKSIDINQVYLIHMILFAGLILSTLIFLIEYVMYFKNEIFKQKIMNNEISP